MLNIVSCLLSLTSLLIDFPKNFVLVRSRRPYNVKSTSTLTFTPISNHNRNYIYKCHRRNIYNNDNGIYVKEMSKRKVDVVVNDHGHDHDESSSHRQQDQQQQQQKIAFHIAGDAYVDFFCFLDGDWPENGGDSRLDQPVKAYAGGSSTNTATHLKSLVRNFMARETSAENDKATEQDKATNSMDGMIMNPPVTLHTVLNPNDHYGELLIKHAEDHDFPIVNCRDENDTSSTGHCIAIVSGGERSFMTHQGCVGSFKAEDLQIEKIVSTETDIHLHVAGFYNIPNFWHGKLKAILETIRQQRKERFPDKNTTISLVTQYDAKGEWDGGLDEILPLLDFAVMNNLEAENIVQRGKEKMGMQRQPKTTENDIHSIREWAQYFGSKSPETNVIVTRGDKGAVALRAGNIIFDQAAIIVKPVDPTGAGDSFTAGFIYGLWSWKFFNATAADGTNTAAAAAATTTAEPWPVDAIKEGLHWGCSVGGAAVLIRGASVPPKREEIEKFRTKAKELVRRLSLAAASVPATTTTTTTTAGTSVGRGSKKGS